MGGCGGGGGGGEGADNTFLGELDIEVSNLESTTYWLELGGYTINSSYQQFEIGSMPPGTTTYPTGPNLWILIFTPGPFEFLLYDTQGGTLLSTSEQFNGINDDILFIEISISGDVVTITDIF